MKQSIQERTAIVDAWVASQYFPAGLLATENNFALLRFECDKIPDLSISQIVAVVDKLGDISRGGRLEYAPPQMTPAEIARKKMEDMTNAGIVPNANSWHTNHEDTNRKLQSAVNERHRAASARENIKAKREALIEVETCPAHRDDGRQDHAEAQRRRVELRLLLPKDGDKNANWSAVLEKVKAKKKQYKN
jgi:predicted outer membrane protein